MAGHDCVITMLSDGCLVVKRFEKAVKSRNHRGLKQVGDIGLDTGVTPVERIIQSEIGQNRNCVDYSSRERRSRELYPREIERFCNLVDSNFSVGNLYLTLTYARKNVSLGEAGTDFENWIKRMRDRYEKDFRYIAVRSFQQRGTLHFHMLSDIPRIPKHQLIDGSFRKIWDHGNVDVRKIYSLPVGFYKGKLKRYLIENLKEFKRDERSFGKRLYLTSNNLVTPLVIRCNAKELEALMEEAGEEATAIKTDCFRNTFLGKVAVTPYKISSQFHMTLLEHFKV